MRPGSWRHLGCKTEDTSLFPPEIFFFLHILKYEDTSHSLHFFKEKLSEGERGTTVFFFLSKHADLFLGRFLTFKFQLLERLHLILITWLL